MRQQAELLLVYHLILRLSCKAALLCAAGMPAQKRQRLLEDQGGTMLASIPAEGSDVARRGGDGDSPRANQKEASSTADPRVEEASGQNGIDVRATAVGSETK